MHDFWADTEEQLHSYMPNVPTEHYNLPFIPCFIHRLQPLIHNATEHIRQLGHFQILTAPKLESLQLISVQEKLTQDVQMRLKWGDTQQMSRRRNLYNLMSKML